MKITKTILTIIISLTFFGLIFGHEMTKEQKQILEKIEQQNKIEEKKRKEIEEQFGLNKPKQQKANGKFFWQDGIGLTTEDITEGRDLSLYTDAGNSDCREFGSKDELSFRCNINRVRNFIWQQWTEKKRGYIRVSTDIVDYQGTAHYFIEPDTEGSWLIVERTVRFQAVSAPHPYSVDKAVYITSVKRIENKSEKDKWTLLLKDKSGKVVWKLPDTE